MQTRTFLHVKLSALNHPTRALDTTPAVKANKDICSVIQFLTLSFMRVHAHSVLSDSLRPMTFRDWSSGSDPEARACSGCPPSAELLSRVMIGVIAYGAQERTHHASSRKIE